MTNFDQIQLELREVTENVRNIIDEHNSNLSSDEQYDDPELWWCLPLLDDLQQAMDNMDSNA